MAVVVWQPLPEAIRLGVLSIRARPSDINLRGLKGRRTWHGPQDQR